MSRVQISPGSYLPLTEVRGFLFAFCCFFYTFFRLSLLLFAFNFGKKRLVFNKNLKKIKYPEKESGFLLFSIRKL
ncbi:hypothetical protein EFR21_03930 [Lactobacillus delbrueckii subsp. bulgaricus]|nr:hypothetical protein [Lactobacillus delbrueckii subsp. bulgaricus]MCT3468626.1 hypothetical protein [Lactobacillus delbrueckii subsp. bulgaricus]MCT3471224.1 hypothetical protein [Lactobacillus delbrueckii subsp. bulgaricus]MCT3474392.1 hypothetical protein [Lactobacillus delbrueckii subsp. bulgaricus]MCT3516411.1 hypothetical protein [Lactobacillus delbrueckii subsp. bulgaricus]